MFRTRFEKELYLSVQKLALTLTHTSNTFKKKNAIESWRFLASTVLGHSRPGVCVWEVLYFLHEFMWQVLSTSTNAVFDHVFNTLEDYSFCCQKHHHVHETKLRELFLV